MSIRLGVVIAGTTMAVIGLALPAHALTPTAGPPENPITAKECTDGGGKIEEGLGYPDPDTCKGGKADGRKIKNGPGKVDRAVVG